ncbi:unnamed protein product, partial [Hapterophycus canaliculatus]
ASAVAGGGGEGRRARQSQSTLARDRERSRAALVLLGELSHLAREPKSLVREKLASMLSSLIRFNIRILLDAPPEKLTRAPEALPSRGDRSYAEEKRRAGVSSPSHFSRV